MRKLRLLALFVVVLAAIFVTANIAVADNGATTTPFKVVYTPAFGSWTCSGAHIVKTGPHAFHKESQTCTDPDNTDLISLAPGTYDIADVGGWLSDYHFFFTSPSTVVFATSGTLVVTDNGDGTSNIEAVTYYAT